MSLIACLAASKSESVNASVLLWE